MWLLTTNSISKDFSWVHCPCLPLGLRGGNGIGGVAYRKCPCHHWPPYNSPGFCCSQDLAIPSPASSYWLKPLLSPSPLDMCDLLLPFPGSDGPTSVLQSFLMLWGFVQQPSQTCLGEEVESKAPGISPALFPSLFNWHTEHAIF